MATIDEHLRLVLARHRIDTSALSPVRGVQSVVEPTIRQWGGPYIVDIGPSGSFAKGTAVGGGTDIDIFVSLSSSVPDPLKTIYETLFTAFSNLGFQPRRQNVSIGLSVGGWKVDVTPGRRQDQYGNYHSLWRNKTGSWLQTNIKEHCRVVSGSGRLDEIRLIKIWRNRYGLSWPSFYLEMFVIDALRGARIGNLEANIITVMRAIADTLVTRRLVDPANTNNALSETLDANEKFHVSQTARAGLNSAWNVVFQ